MASPSCLNWCPLLRDRRIDSSFDSLSLTNKELSSTGYFASLSSSSSRSSSSELWKSLISFSIASSCIPSNTIKHGKIVVNLSYGVASVAQVNHCPVAIDMVDLCLLSTLIGPLMVVVPKSLLVRVLQEHHPISPLLLFAWMEEHENRSPTSF